jgi:type II restriction enzyme
MKSENPGLIDRLRTSAFTNLAPIFFETKPEDEHDYISMIGLLNGKRVMRFVRKDYIKDISDTLDKFCLLVSKANGSGQFGETLSTPIIAEPNTGYTQTFIGIGKYNTMLEAENTEKYIKTKFVRAMLGILKITQDCPGPKWKYVPLQDFTSTSDIDWTQPIAAIDQQLYKKYDLTPDEIGFIETHVKEME